MNKNVDKIFIRMDGYESDPTGGDWFCYHGSSPFVFPPGFCDRNNIKLKVLTQRQVGVLATSLCNQGW